MKKLMFIVALLFAGCSKEQTQESDPEQTQEYRRNDINQIPEHLKQYDMIEDSVEPRAP